MSMVAITNKVYRLFYLKFSHLTNALCTLAKTKMIEGRVEVGSQPHRFPALDNTAGPKRQTLIPDVLNKPLNKFP